MSTETLLEGCELRIGEGAIPPIAGAAALLQSLGGAVDISRSRRSTQLELDAPSGGTSTVDLDGWRGEQVLRDALNHVGEPRLAPTGAVLTSYSAARVAAAALVPGPCTLRLGDLLEALLAARHARGRIKPELLACKDGWAVARFRDDDERDLLDALVGRPAEAGLDATVSAAREARMLVAAVRPPAATTSLKAPAFFPAPPTPQADPMNGEGVVDWTVLWAGPWAAGELAREGVAVVRVEHPRRRDGLLSHEPGRLWWAEMNESKELYLLDARTDIDQLRLQELIASASVLITSMTPRALHSLGFDDVWRTGAAPGLLHVEIVAFDDPHADLPGLGEHAAAEAGLLWNGGDVPALPYPWPDPIVGALTLMLCRAARTTSSPSAGRLRLTLEHGARLATLLDDES